MFVCGSARLRGSDCLIQAVPLPLVQDGIRLATGGGKFRSRHLAFV
jgi:hypothetical protein